MSVNVRFAAIYPTARVCGGFGKRYGRQESVRYSPFMSVNVRFAAIYPTARVCGEVGKRYGVVKRTPVLFAT